MILTVNVEEEANLKEETKLLEQIVSTLPQLKELLLKVNGHWAYEDGVYRFYHQSFKVFHLQESTLEIVAALRGLAPHLRLNAWFLQIVDQGTSRKFDMNRRNDYWLEETRPILEAFFHARHFLEMICKYGRALKEPPMAMPSGWATVLYLYGLR
jgi:hypothetical protein